MTEPEPLLNINPDEMKIVANLTNCAANGLEIVAAGPRRNWMDNSIPNTFANRCLPLLMASQLGWNVITTHSVVLHSKYDGFFDIEYVDEKGPANAAKPINNFGNNIVTWPVPWLFTTPKGWDLFIHPPCNEPNRPGVTVLSGIVETDHTVASFTLNWLVQPPTTVVVNAGDVIATIMPYPTGMLDHFSISESVHTVPDGYHKWAYERNKWNAENRNPKAWQKDYWNSAKRRKIKRRELKMLRASHNDDSQ